MKEKLLALLERIGMKLTSTRTLALILATALRVNNKLDEMYFFYVLLLFIGLKSFEHINFFNGKK